MSLRIEEVLHGRLPLQVGNVIEASRYDDTFACWLGCVSLEVGDQALALYRPGEPALPPCAARDACTAGCGAESTNANEYWMNPCTCRQSPAAQPIPLESPTCGVAVIPDWHECVEACERDTAEVGPARLAQDYKRGTVSLYPWSDPIVFARSDQGEVSVPVSELDQLWTSAAEDPASVYAACVQRFGDWTDLRPHARVPNLQVQDLLGRLVDEVVPVSRARLEPRTHSR